MSAQSFIEPQGNKQLVAYMYIKQTVLASWQIDRKQPHESAIVVWYKIKVLGPQYQGRGFKSLPCESPCLSLLLNSYTLSLSFLSSPRSGQKYKWVGLPVKVVVIV
jgi:hypothetical protein